MPWPRRRLVLVDGEGVSRNRQFARPGQRAEPGGCDFVLGQSFFGVRGPQPISGALHAWNVDRHRRRSGPHRCAEITFENRAVVAVPVQLHALARTLIPDGREVRGADAVILGETEKLVLVRVEGVDASRPRRGIPVDKRECRRLLQQDLLHLRHRLAQNQRLDRAQTGVFANRRQDFDFVEALILGALLQKYRVFAQVDAVGRHAEDKDALSLDGRQIGRFARIDLLRTHAGDDFHRADVTDGTVEADPIHVDASFAEADRQIVSHLDQEAELLVARQRRPILWRQRTKAPRAPADGRETSPAARARSSRGCPSRRRSRWNRI